MTLQPASSRRGSDTLADVLERVLDKGVVIAGDIVVSVLDIELLTLKLRLFVASAETAREMGMDWGTNDPFFTGRPVEQRTDDSAAVRSGEGDRLRALEAENDELRRRLAAVEAGTNGGTTDDTDTDEAALSLDSGERRSQR